MPGKLNNPKPVMGSPVCTNYAREQCVLQPRPVWWDQKHPEGHFLALDIFATGRCHLRERSSNVLRDRWGLVLQHTLLARAVRTFCLAAGEH